MKKSLLAFVGLVCLSGCATMQQQASGSATPLSIDYMVSAPFDQVWGKLVERATDRSWPLKTIDKASGIIVTDFSSLGDGISGWQALKQLAYEPSMFLATWAGGARMKLSVFVSKIAENQTRVKLNAHFEGFENNVTHQWVVWQSNGLDEKGVVDYIASELHAQVQPYVNSTASTQGSSTSNAK